MRIFLARIFLIVATLFFSICNANNGDNIMDTTLSNIIDSYWSDYIKHKDKDYIVSPSVPIIWFGNMEAYKDSRRKIVTIAINPSHIEFKDNGESSFFRFPNAKNLYKKETLSHSDKILLASDFNAYFQNEPYMKWFDYYEKPLNALNASYKSGKNIALHIDIYTALASEPTWGALSPQRKEAITNIELFKNLLAYLKPNIVLYSGDYKVFQKVFLAEKKQPIYEQSYTTQKGVVLKIMAFRINEQLVIFGSNVRGNPMQLKSDFIQKAISEIDDILEDY